MPTIRVRATLDAAMLVRPELQSLLGQEVEIVGEPKPAFDPRAAFFAAAMERPETPDAYAAWQAQFRAWRGDPRFEPIYSWLDPLLARSYEAHREKVELLERTSGMWADVDEGWKHAMHVARKGAPSPLSEASP